MWLDALTDNMANVFVDSAQLCTLDVLADGDHYLAATDKNKKLKVWRNSELYSEEALPYEPTAVAVLCTEARIQEIALPLLAVAAGPYVFLYRKLKLLYKFRIVQNPISAAEADLWKGLEAGSLTVQTCVSSLRGLQANGICLSGKANRIMNIRDSKAQEDFAKRNTTPPVVDHTAITCLAVLRKRDDESGVAGSLLLGTESGYIIFLDETCTSERKRIKFGSTPVFLATHGAMDIDWRIFVAVRDGKIYCVHQTKEPQVL